MKHGLTSLFAILLTFGNFAFGQTLLYYWNFNTSTTEQTLLAPTFALSGTPTIAHVQGGTSVIQITSNTGQDFDINNWNAQNGDAALSHLRLNNPIGAELILSVPTTGYKDVVIKYATRRSGSGAGTQTVEYSTDGSSYQAFTTINPPDGAPSLETLDFSAITAADDNANFKIKITFSQGSGGTVGNNRFDNLTVSGTSLLGGDITAPAVTFTPLDASVNVPTQVVAEIKFSENTRLIDNSALSNTNVDALVDFRLTDAAGALVAFDATVSGNTILVTPAQALLHNQTYYLALKANVVEDESDNVVAQVQSTSFTTITPQTAFAPGDLVLVAYRMNATGTEDEIAVLTLVNILPGTFVNFTDAKYTDNTPAQCAGGFTWQAPSSGVAAGTVFTIQNDAQIASIGTLTGSGFGLSSGGDQVIVYTGTPQNPTFITALSSNAWVANNASCGGSASKIPAGLTDGTSAINLSTAPGNVSGNTVNAYYNGTMAGTTTQLRAAILNPVNWVGIGGSTAPQTWPAWTFPGPPSVVSVVALNQNTLRVIFSQDLNNASATNMSNFTGIAGLTGITQTSNGSLADSLVLTFSSAFVSGQNYVLTIENVMGSNGLSMFTPFVYNFTYQTSIAFSKPFFVASENDGKFFITLDVTNPSAATVALNLKAEPFSTAAGAGVDVVFANRSVSATQSQISIEVKIVDDTRKEQDEYLVFALESPAGLTITGSKYLTVFIKDNDRKAPVPNKEIELLPVASFEPVGNGSTTEIVAFDPDSKRLFATSAIEGRLDIIDFSNPASPALVKSVDMNTYGGITSVAVYNGIVAVASPNANEQLDGSLVIFNTNGDFQKQVTVGALPDMVTFSPDGKLILTANEGQPNSNYLVDPEGSVSIIDISGGVASLDQTKVTTLTFTAFNSQETTLVASGVRKTWAAGTLSKDFEPEFITVSPDNKKAWVTLQENNAMGEINLETKTITDVWALGTKNMNTMGFGFDASDKSGVPLLANWNVKAFYIPDAVASFEVQGKTYLITANEGDEKEYDALNERTTVDNASVVLNPTNYPNAEVLKQAHNLGRLRITNLNGKNPNTNQYDELYVLGGRSFTIWDAEAQTGVFDSGDEIELFTSTYAKTKGIFNADNEDNTLKGRSRAKGPEPEGVTVAKIGNQVYAFIALERVGGVMVYNVTNPYAPVLADYNTMRDTSAYAGDNGPEGITYIAPSKSPNGKPYVVVANELSGTLSIFEVKGVDLTGVETPVRENELMAYPNPVNNGTALQFNKTISLSLYTLDGKLVLSAAETDMLSVQGLAPGMYILKSSSGETLKIAVN